jgi:hypothetical protein
VLVGEDRGGDMMAFAARDGWELINDGWDEHDFDFDPGDLQAGPNGHLWYRANDGVRTLRDGPSGTPTADGDHRSRRQTGDSPTSPGMTTAPDTRPKQ